MSKDLYTWGEGLNGQLGNGATAVVLSPSFVSAGWVDVSTSASHVLALKANGTLWAWGGNVGNELGTGGSTTLRTLMPTQVGTDTDWVRISAGRGYSLALKANGSMWAWGTSGVYEFHATPNTVFTTPTLIDVGPWSEIRANDRLTQAIKPDGSLWSRGSNNNGKLGINVANTGPTEAQGSFRSVFTREFTNATDWLDFPTASEVTNIGMARKVGGAVHAAGYAPDYPSLNSLAYVLFVPNTWLSVAFNNGNYWGVRTDGTLWQWGWNFVTSTSMTTPQQIGSASNWMGAIMGYNEGNAGAYNTTGELYTLGYRAGDGTTNTLTTLTLVLSGVSKAFTATSAFLALKIFIPPFWTNFQSTREVL